MSLPVLQSRYALENEIARGGMSLVYKARDLRLNGKFVAVKKMMVPDDSVENLGQQFQKEAEILASLSHPGVVQVIDYLEEDGSQYLVMPLVEGLTFSDMVNKAPAYLPVTRVIAWLDQLLDVLIYLHGRTPPVLVRDLKPTNIMLDQWGHLKLIDFGLARFYAPGTRTRTFLKGVLTPGFAPVEQYSASTDPRSDIYALGATTYALLTREFLMESVMRATGTSLERISAINPEVPAALEVIISKMMEISRDSRYQTAVEVREALNEAVGDLVKLGTSSLVKLQTSLPESAADRGFSHDELLELATRSVEGHPAKGGEGAGSAPAKKSQDTAVASPTPSPRKAHPPSPPKAIPPSPPKASPPSPPKASPPPPPKADDGDMLIPATRMMNKGKTPPPADDDRDAMEVPTRLPEKAPQATQVPPSPPATPPAATPAAENIDISATLKNPAAAPAPDPAPPVPTLATPPSRFPEMVVPMTIRMPPLRVDRTAEEDDRLRWELYAVGTLEFVLGMFLLIVGVVGVSEEMNFRTMGVPLAGGIIGALGTRYIFYAGNLKEVLERAAGWLRLWILLTIVMTSLSWAGFVLIRLFMQSGSVADFFWMLVGLLLIVMNVRMLQHTMSLFEKE